MSGADRQRREAVLHEFAMRNRRTQSRLARRAAAMRAVAALRLAAATTGGSRSSA